MEETMTAILPRLGSGLSVLLLHLLTTLALLALNQTTRHWHTGEPV
jgi:hypothetical protein